MAGPAMEQNCQMALEQLIAAPISSRFTTVGARAREAGVRKARPAPSRASKARIGQIFDVPLIATKVMPMIATNSTSMQMAMMRRREYLSAKVPVSMTRSSTGRNCTSPTRPRSKGSREMS